MKKSFHRCAAPRCTVRVDGEVLCKSPQNDPERYFIWAQFAGIEVGTRCKRFYLCQKHFERKNFSFCKEKPIMLLRTCKAIPTIHCQGPDMATSSGTRRSSYKSSFQPLVTVVNTKVTMEDSNGPTCEVPQHDVNTKVTTEDPKGPTSDIIVSGMNEVVTLTEKVKVEDDSEEEFLDETPMEIYESLPGVPQCNTQRIISQSSQDQYHIIEELAELYSHITLPYLEQSNLNLQWLYKILSREEGCERIFYETPNKDEKDGFLLIRDSKWDGINLDNLHLIAIAYRAGVMSLRDLGRKHLGILQNINFVGKEVIRKTYNVVASQLRVFLQYPPSFYHLHVHFTALNDDICGPQYATAHPISSVIHNIQTSPSYYQDAPLSLYLKESDELFQRFEDRGIVKRIQPSS